MKKGVLFIVAGILTLVRSAYTDLEIVWVKDMTSYFQTDKRTLNDVKLPDDLTFHLSHKSHDLKLKLRRNHAIDPNAEVYFMRKLKDGQYSVEKALNLQDEDVAYYQDRENGAFMTVRCVRRSNGQCDRIINGNVRIGDRNYDLRPTETGATSRSLLDVPYLAKRYFLRGQPNIRRELLFNKIDKKNYARKIYWVDIAVLIDSAIWNLHKSLNLRPHVSQVTQKIKEFYSHIINGVNLLFHEIEDNRIEINVILQQFHIFQEMNDFPHRDSIVQTVGGKTYIDAHKYLNDIANWDKSYSYKYKQYDHAMIFTRHDLYIGTFKDNNITGMTDIEGICDIGKRSSIIEVGDYFGTVTTAAHELGHNLGAEDDGIGKAKACPAGDLFIMAPSLPIFKKGEPYSRNPWMFSNCSVDAFEDILKNKPCVTNEGVFFDKQLWKKYTANLPGETYTPNKQCQLINGLTSGFCGDVSADICRFMQCRDPITGLCLSKYFMAARGTYCGANMWCKEGRCVQKL